MVKVLVGMMGSSVASGSKSMATPEQVSEFLSVVESHGVNEIDTARVYNGGRSEELLGEVSAFKTFAIATKAPAFSPGSLTREKIIENCNKSLQALRQDRVDLYYLHGPDSQTPLAEQCDAINQLYREGKFERWGISNLSDAQVQEIYDICTKKGYLLPKVYQGSFSPLLRKSADTLLPLLRKLDMVFYAYSPLAGGLLAKPIDEILRPREGTRYHEMPIFGNLFLNETIIRELRKLSELCKSRDVPIMEATIRWFRHHSPLSDEDGFILGASSTAQIEASLAACEKGPLPADILKEFEDMWIAIKHKSPGYC